MANWTQPQCEACWIEKNTEIREIDGEAHTVVRQPTTFKNPDNPSIEQCAWCGRMTIMGIFVRVDPTTVPFPSEE